MLIKSAYWIALLLIAAMATGSYILLQQLIADHQRDENVVQLISSQKALSQRVIFLATATSLAQSDERAPLVTALRLATNEFENGYDQLVQLSSENSQLIDKETKAAIEPIFYSAPHHLDYFSLGLLSNAKRLIAAYDTPNEMVTEPRYRAGMEKALMDDTIAHAVLTGYDALSFEISQINSLVLERLLAVNRNIFLVTIGLLVLIGAFIFRPMAEMMRRKTHDLVQARNSMAFIAAHDSLTGLHNRTVLRDQIDPLLLKASKAMRLAVIQFDLDRFKQVNDTLGHATGDQVLKETARRLREVSRSSDLCIRLGGDEFIIVLNGVGSDEDVAAVATRALEHINCPIFCSRGVVMPGASAGIALYPQDGRTSEELLMHADLALYSAKKQGGGGYSFFSEGLRRELEYSKQIEKDLRTAIAEEAFEVYFQPQISLSSGEVTGIEALTRWTHPVTGPISPAEFIPVAEKAGLMAALGRIILTSAVSTAAEWHKAGISFGRLAVNVTGAEIQEKDFTDFIVGTLRHFGLPSDHFSLEIVESVILDDEKTDIAAKLRYIRAAGVHLELDDFGTGYASLTHISPSEIDRIKIDRRFVQYIESHSENRKIVRAICELASSLGLSVVAEGAETRLELDTLASIGCDEVQGYGIAHPMPAPAALDWLRANNQKLKQYSA